MAHKKTQKRSRFCYFCVNKQIGIDYKNTDLIRRFLSSFARIVPRKRSGLCSEHQRKLSTEVKRARVMALVPFIAE